MSKGSASFTISDLIDTATYIYYAEDSNGTNASPIPSSNKKYIGFYNGPSLIGGPPTSQEEINKLNLQWSQYQGEAGRGIKKTLIHYCISESGTEHPVVDDPNWSETIPLAEDGKFLWTRTTIFYTDPENSKSYSYSVSHSDVSGKFYEINSDQTEILKFFEKDESGKINTIFSPKKIEIFIKEIVKEEAKIIDVKKEDISFDLIGTNNDSNDFINLDFLQDTPYNFIFKSNFLKWELKVQDLYIYLKELTITEENLKLQNILSFLERDKSLLKITIFRNNKVFLTKIFPIRYGSNSELANLSLNASGINLSIAKNKLSFDAEGLKIYNSGLTIYNNGITIYDEKGKPTLEADAQTGKLILKNIEASGKIEATSGVLKKVYIGNIEQTLITKKGTEYNKVIHIDDTGIYSDNFLKDNTEGFSLSTNGQLKANSIILGDYVTVDNFIKLGNSYIYNPEKNNRKFISILNPEQPETEYVSLTDEGEGNIGNITFSGVNSRLAAKSWTITPELATFNNINVSGTINTSIFNKNTIQLSGSNFLFKDGILLKEENILLKGKNSLTIKLSESDGLKVNNKIVYVTNQITDNIDNTKSSYFIASCQKEINSTNNFLLTSLNGEIQDANYSILLILGDSAGDNFDKLTFKEWLIGVNATSNDMPQYSLPSNSIGFSELSLIKDKSNQSQNTYNLTAIPKIILGKIPLNLLDNKDKSGNSTYGLYAHSVFLTGTLSTRYQDDKGKLYAGINTLSKANFNISLPNKLEQDRSPIIFWAGSTTTSDEDIQKAPFQITSNGTLYAQQGYFKGSIITDATIKASKVETATLVGGSEGSPALTIMDAYKGIHFIGKEGDEPLLELTQDGLVLGVPIKFKNNQDNQNEIFLEGSQSEYSKIIVRNKNKENATFSDLDNNLSSIIIQPNGLGFLNNNTYDDLSGSIYQLKVVTENHKEKLALNYTDTKSNLVTFDKDVINFFERTQFKEGISLGDFANPNIEYKIADVGVDIYIHE